MAKIVILCYVYFTNIKFFNFTEQYSQKKIFLETMPRQFHGVLLPKHIYGSQAILTVRNSDG